MYKSVKDLDNFLEKVRKEGIGHKRFKEGDPVIRVYKNPNQTIDKIVSGTIDEIIVEFNGNNRQFAKKIKVRGYDEVFSPKKFKRFYPPTIL